MGSGPRFGVEEEFLVVDVESKAVAPQAAAVLERAGGRLGARLSGEITKLQLETRTDPCTATTLLHAQLAEARAVLAEAARDAGLGIVASGSPVVGDGTPPPVTEGPRQEMGCAAFRALHDELAVCAMHVHVEVPDRDRAVLAGNHLRPLLPTLSALAANSPYWAGRDTGYASWRTVTWTRWPVAGPPPYFTSAAHYDDMIGMLLECGALVDVGTVFWDIRPSAHLPTLEVRVADVPITAEDTAALAALIRALVVQALGEVDRGEKGPQIPSELLRPAYWRAARDGLSGHGVDLLTGRLVTVAEQAWSLVRSAAPALTEHGDLERVTGWLRRMTVQGTGAVRQRRVADRNGGQLPAVVDYLMEQTGPSAGPFAAV
jgi:glutamate---cysteine ligase / carboxylate-amine ligase